MRGALRIAAAALLALLLAGQNGAQDGSSAAATMTMPENEVPENEVPESGDAARPDRAVSTETPSSHGGETEPDVNAAPPADPFANAGSKAAHVARVCALIDEAAQRNGLPKPFLARLIWKESRFDPQAVSPVGALGIAQFMPGTAALRKLANPFDVEQAIGASAAYLAEMTRTYGSLGRAAIGYNAGEGRLQGWMGRGGGYLPAETEDYVLSILGVPADRFTDDAFQPTIQPLVADLGFREACQELPVLRTRAFPVSPDVAAGAPQKPWGVQVAGHARQSVAQRQWDRLRREHPILSDQTPHIGRVRAPAGRIYAVQIGADSRGEADRLCQRLRAEGGSCIIRKN